MSLSFVRTCLSQKKDESSVVAMECSTLLDNRDLVCEVKTRKFWDSDAECWDYEPFCPKHQAIVNAELEDNDY